MFVALSVVATVAVWRASRLKRLDYKTVIAIAIVLRILLIPLAPTLSDDGYRYVWDGLVQSVEGENPYTYRPSDDALDTLRSRPSGQAVSAHLNSTDYYSVYPPLAQLVFAFAGLFEPLGWLAVWYAIKLIFVGVETAGLVYAGRRVRPSALALYAWNPLVVVEVAGQAHTEALAAGFILLALGGAAKGRGSSAAGSLCAAGWAKLVPFVVLPLSVFGGTRRGIGWGGVLALGGLSLLVVLPYAAPYTAAHVAESLALYVQFFEFNAGPYLLLKSLMGWITGDDWSKTLGPALQLLLVGGLVVIYRQSVVRSWSLSVGGSLAVGLFLATATTIHPWYLVLILVFIPFLYSECGHAAARWYGASWLWLAAVAPFTYLLYTGSDQAYWCAVWVGWIGWGLLVTIALVAAGIISPLMRFRARQKWKWMRDEVLRAVPLNAHSRVLDLGAGEGWVGEAIASDTSAIVTLADVVEGNETTLPHVQYDGRRLPFADHAFDVTLLVFVLHHADEAEAVIREARRVTRKAIVIVESVYTNPRNHALLRLLDRSANRLRLGGALEEQEPNLHFRTDAAWRAPLCV